MRRHKHLAGFTLIEVLVALTILAIALGASLRAVAAMTQNSESLRAKMYASWSADNQLTQLRLSGVSPPVGTRDMPCPQGNIPLQCVMETRTTANAYMNRIELQIYRDATRHESVLTVTTIMPNR